MNILGQEQPVIYKMDDMFDPATAQMFLAAQQNYANAVRQDYMQAAQDLKEYNTKYGDFYSPYSKDNLNWDRLVNEPIRKLMQNYSPDMIRSQEGRSMIAQVIASIPGGDLAKLRASALQGINALKVKAELEAKGLYSQDYQDFLDKQAGRTSFKDWDTLKDGVYNSTFSPFQGLGEVTDYIYKGRQPLYKGMKNGQRRYAYDYNDLLNAAQSNAQDFIKTPRGAFEWEIAQRQAAQQNPTASPEQLQKAAYDILDRRIANANMRYLSPDKYEVDPFALARYQSSLRIGEQREAARLQAANNMPNNDILQYSDRKRYDINQSYIDKTLGGINRVKSLLGIQQYWNNRLAKATNLVNQLKNSTNAKKRKEALNEYNYAKAHANWWKGSENWGPKELVKNGIISFDRNGSAVPTSRFTNAFAYSNSTDNIRKGDNKSLMNHAKNYYGMYQTNISGANTYELDAWKDVMAQSNDLVSIPGSGNKYRAVQLNGSGLRYAPIRQINMSGTRMLKYNSIQRKFDRWLRSGGAGNGYLVLPQLKIAELGKGYRQGSQIDIQGNISITSDQFKKFCDHNGITNYTKAAVELGLGVYNGRTAITLSSDDVNNDAIRSNDNKYVDSYYTIPMIRTINNNGGFFWRDMNTRINNKEYGSAKAYAEEPNAEAASVMVR